jgi:hypothetical protein
MAEKIMTVPGQSMAGGTFACFLRMEEFSKVSGKAWVFQHETIVEAFTSHRHGHNHRHPGEK